MALRNRSMLGAWGGHVAIGVSAMSCFALEDSPAVVARFPYMHAAWHMLSALGFMSLATFLTKLETVQLAAGAGSVVRGAAGGRRRVLLLTAA